MTDPFLRVGARGYVTEPFFGMGGLPRHVASHVSAHGQRGGAGGFVTEPFFGMGSRVCDRPFSRDGVSSFVTRPFSRDGVASFVTEPFFGMGSRVL